MKKILALLLAVVMVAGMFAGCQSNGNEATTPATTPANNSSDTNTNNTPADTNNGEIVDLKWYMVGGGMPANYDSWKAQIDAYLEEKIGVHLSVECVSWGDWGNRRSVIVQTNENYDIIFTDMSTYATDVAMGAFADLTDLIAETPGLTDLIPQTYIDACKIGGKLYAIPTYKDSSMTNFFVWTTEYAEAYYPEYKDAHTLADISDGLAAVMEGSGYGLLLNQDGISSIVGNKYDNLGTGLPAIGVSYFDGTAKVVATFEQEDVMNDLKTINGWFNAGLINSDAAVLPEANGMCALGVAQGWPSAAGSWGDGRGAEVTAVQFEQTVVSNDTVQGSLNCISASSAHKAEALKLLELVNTDSYVRDLMAYGEEGVNFEYVEEDGEQKVSKLNNDWTLAAYTQGTFFNLSMVAGTVGNPYVDEVLVQNENAVPSPALGFSFDMSSVSDELSACTAIFEQYKSILFTGTTDPESTVEEMMKALRASGFDTIVAEAQSQLDTFLAG